MNFWNNLKKQNLIIFLILAMITVIIVILIL